MKAELILENGMRFAGEMFGAERDVVGEIVFTTAAGGYQETVTDPSFAGQIVTMTFPIFGCYGANSFDNEAKKAAMLALIVRDKCDFPSNFRCEMTVDEFLKQQGVVGISGVDTRELTRVIRRYGTMKAVIVSGQISTAEARERMEEYDSSDVIMQTTTDSTYVYSPKGDTNVAVIDLGTKESVLAELQDRKCKVTVFPANAKADEIMAINPDVVFVSSGPGNPAKAPGTVETVKALLGKVKVCGICTGHLVIALALGCTVDKLDFGHHGANYPVKDLASGRVFITAQNNNYVVTRLADGVTETYKNVNDGTCAGFECKELNVESVLFRPHGETRIYGDGFIYDRFLGKEEK
ncbi:MAG: glutamine-hydrolyzing carbamoyl-phosphate synthase small subunit [Clostridia bacterium]|nr:glutamine-hydrolyzing carbamoyl-phosphate synthase small subunit [Clostridia bacterium]